MQSDVLEQLHELGAHLDQTAPRVDADEVFARLHTSGVRRDATHGAGHGEDDNHHPGLGDVGPRRLRWRTSAAAVVLVAGVLGLVVVAGRPGNDPTRTSGSTPDAPTSVLIEPSVFPVIGDRPGPRDFGSVGVIDADNPVRISALIARGDGNTISGGLSVTATGAAVVDPPAGTAPSEAVGVQTFDVQGREAEVWTEPFEVPVQHVRFAGEPTLEVAGVDSLAFIQAAGPDAIRVVEADDGSFALEIGELPDGFEVIVDPFVEQRGAVTASVSVGATDSTEGDHVSVGVSDPLPGLATYNPTLTAVDIDGHRGWVASGAGYYVVWEPSAGTFVTAGATESAEASIALARSVRLVDRDTWMAFYDVEGMPSTPAAAVPPIGEAERPTATSSAVVPDNTGPVEQRNSSHGEPTSFPVVDQTDGGVTATASVRPIQEGVTTPRTEMLLGRQVDGVLTDAVTVTAQATPFGTSPAAGRPATEATVMGESATVIDRSGNPGDHVYVLWGSGPYFLAAGADPLTLLEQLEVGAIHAVVDLGVDQPPLIGGWSLPGGFELIAGPQTIGHSETSVATLAIGADVDVSVATQNPLIQMALDGPLQSIEVNGKPAWTFLPSTPMRDITWQVDDTTYAYLAVRDDSDTADALELANRLTFVDEATWMTRYPPESTTVTPTSAPEEG